MKYPKNQLKAAQYAIGSAEEIVAELFRDKTNDCFEEKEIEKIFYGLNDMWLKLFAMMKEEDRPSV